MSRVNLKSANKRTLESISLSGGFDSFDIYRSQLFYTEDSVSYLEKMMRFGSAIQIRKKFNSN